MRTSFLALRKVRRGFSQDVALHRHTRQLCTKTAVLHLLGSHLRLAAGALQGASSMFPDPVAQGLLKHAQTACSCRLALARLNKPRRLLLELKRVTSPLRLRHLRYPFALEQLAKGYVLRGQGHTVRVPHPFPRFLR